MTQTQATDSAAPVLHTVVQKQECQAWAQVPAAVMDSGIRSGPLSYLLLLVNKMKFGSASNCWDEERFDGNKSIAESLNCSTRTVQRHRRYLVDNGWIICTPRFLKKGGQTSNLVKLNIPKLVSARSAFSRQQACHPAHDKADTPPVTEMSPKLNPSLPTKPPTYKTTGAEWSELEKEVSERFKAVAPPRVKFNIETFRKMQAEDEMNSSEIQAKLSELAASPFLAAECRSIAMIYYLIDRESKAYDKARDSVKSLRLAIRRAKTQDDVEVAIAKVSAKSGWARDHLAHYIRTKLGFDVKPGAPEATKRAWVNVNQPPNPFAKSDEPANWFGDITGDEDYTQPTASPSLSNDWGDITGDEAPETPPAASDTRVAERVPVPDRSDCPTPAPAETPSGEGATAPVPAEGRNGPQSGAAEAREGHPPAEPPPPFSGLKQPTSAAEVLARVGMVQSPAGIDLLGELLATNPPDSEVVISGLLSAEAQDLAQAA